MGVWSRATNALASEDMDHMMVRYEVALVAYVSIHLFPSRYQMSWNCGMGVLQGFERAMERQDSGQGRHCTFTREVLLFMNHVHAGQ